MSWDIHQIKNETAAYLRDQADAIGGTFSEAKTHTHALEQLAHGPGDRFRVVMSWANTSNASRSKINSAALVSTFSFHLLHHAGFSIDPGDNISHGRDTGESLLDLHSWLYSHLIAIEFQDDDPANCYKFSLQGSSPLIFEDEAGAPAHDGIRLDFSIHHLPTLPAATVLITHDP